MVNGFTAVKETVMFLGYLGQMMMNIIAIVTLLGLLSIPLVGVILSGYIVITQPSIIFAGLFIFMILATCAIYFGKDGDSM